MRFRRDYSFTQTEVRDFEHACDVARSRSFDTFILDGIKYIEFDGKYRREENENKENCRRS